FTVQVADATPGASYYVEVLALDPVGAHNVGNYFLGVDFRPQAVALQTYGQGQLAAAQPKATTSFSVDMSSEFHFVLSANTSGAAGVRVLMTIFDEAGNAVYSLGATAGMPVSGNVYLKRGTYTVRYLAGTLDGSPLPDVTFNLKGLRTSDNNGPQPVDPTSSPSGSSSTSSGSTSNNNPGSSGVSSQPSYSDPYSTQEQQDWFYYWDASNSSSGSSSSSSDSSTYYS
ncbi:MAG TPA: hypothetical protein VKD72_08790, partial [Gemmataceae bacterium]|nr:hypothetical protein [Gemmataceae bacterium]